MHFKNLPSPPLAQASDDHTLDVGKLPSTSCKGENGSPLELELALPWSIISLKLPTQVESGFSEMPRGQAFCIDKAELACGSGQLMKCHREIYALIPKVTCFLLQGHAGNPLPSHRLNFLGTGVTGMAGSLSPTLLI